MMMCGKNFDVKCKSEQHKYNFSRYKLQLHYTDHHCNNLEVKNFEKHFF